MNAGFDYIYDKVNQESRIRNREFEVTIKFVATTNTLQLHELLAGRHVRTPHEALAIIDTVLRELPIQRYISIGRFFYSQDLKTLQHLGSGLESWWGLLSECKTSSDGFVTILVGYFLFDMASAVFIEPLPVIDFVAQILNKDVRSGTIFPVDEEMNMKSVTKYFQEKYGFTIQFSHLACLKTVLFVLLAQLNLKYHDTGKDKVYKPQVERWNMLNKHPRRQDSRILSGIGPNVNLIMSRLLPIFSARPDQVKKALKHVANAASDKLGDLKRICETDLGLISQCCLTKHVVKVRKQYISNLLLKINVKASSLLHEGLKYFISYIANIQYSLLSLSQMGRRNNVLFDALSLRIPLVSDIPTIMLGADVTHLESLEDYPSIAAVC
ncbi:Piwi domain [Dillenia turbinata]|uniref:Piwi domain n=1 Tax=Dillenia turbinata TaxID=194707 RepID=A0AAN8W4U7_9MAGN